MAATSDDYQALFDANPRPMWVFDLETLAFLLVNDAACAHYGWTREELLRMTIRDLRAPEEVPRLDHALGGSRACADTAFTRIGQHLTKDGRRIEVEVDLRRVAFRGRAAMLAVVTDLTGSVDAEHRFRLLVEHSADGIALFDEQRVIRYMSPAGERIHGRSPGALIGQSAAALGHPEDLSAAKPSGPGETVTNVLRVNHRDGTWRWIEATTTNLVLDPAIRGYVANFRDITERRETETAMRDTRRRLEYLLSATRAITYTAQIPVGRGATFISANVKDVLGYEPSLAMTDGFWLDNIHPDDRPRVEAELQALYATDRQSIEYRFRHADGSYRWMHDDKRVVRELDGRPKELVGCWLDVTERHRVEESLRHSEANFRALIEKAPTVTLVQRGGRFVYVSPAAAAALGYHGADEVVGRPVLDFVDPDDHELIRARMANTVKQGWSPLAEFKMLRRDGSAVVIEAEAMLLPFDGQPSNVVIGRDVSERREMFARIAVADRMLSVGTLAAGVAHEINNPLTYVISNLALLARELPMLLAGKGGARLDGSQVHGLLADAQEGAARVSAIVRDLRALSRPDDEARGPVDVLAVLTSSIKMAHNELRHRANVMQTFEAGLPLVHANAIRLGQVFLNLLLNAAQAIPDGRADANEIRLRAHASVDRQHVVIEVEDTGVGIPSSVIGRIFDPFFTTKPIGVGTGLGLAICHQIVSSIGGEIAATSTPGQGTTFRVQLPVEAAAAPQVAAPPAPLRLSPPSRVLMIDDEAAVGRTLRHLLAPDHEIVPVTCAKDALGWIVAGEQFDVIFCDLMMPEMSGIEFHEQLAIAAPQYLERIVFMTGGAFTEHARRFLEAQRRPALEKPFTEEAVRRAIERVRSSCEGEEPRRPR